MSAEMITGEIDRGLAIQLMQFTTEKGLEHIGISLPEMYPERTELELPSSNLHFAFSKFVQSAREAQGTDRDYPTAWRNSAYKKGVEASLEVRRMYELASFSLGHTLGIVASTRSDSDNNLGANNV